MSDRIRKIRLDWETAISKEIANLKTIFHVQNNKIGEHSIQLGTLEKKLETLDLEKKLKIDYMLKMNQLEKNDKTHQALYGRLEGLIQEASEERGAINKTIREILNALTNKEIITMDSANHLREKLGYIKDTGLLNRLTENRLTGKKEYQLKFRDIITDIIDIMGYCRGDEEVKEIEEYLVDIDKEYIIVKKLKNK